MTDTRTTTYSISVAGLTLRLVCGLWPVGAVPANFRPFLAAEDGDSCGSPSATLTVVTAPELPAEPQERPLSTSWNDLGRASLYRQPDGRWLVALAPGPDEQPRIMVMDPDFRSARLWLLDGDPWGNFCVDSSSRILFSQFAASCGALIVHASAIELDGEGFIFMGRSGTGKSTHSRLWQSCFPAANLVNDDCPLLIPSASGTGFDVCGTPWSGKTHCWRQCRYPLRGVVRLRQAQADGFKALDPLDAFIAFLPGMSVMSADAELYDRASTTALNLLQSVPAGILDCLPHEAAARLCRRSLASLQKLNEKELI